MDRRTAIKTALAGVVCGVAGIEAKAAASLPKYRLVTVSGPMTARGIVLPSVPLTKVSKLSFYTNGCLLRELEWKDGAWVDANPS